MDDTSYPAGCERQAHGSSLPAGGRCSMHNPAPPVHYAYFAPYPMQRHDQLVHSMQVQVHSHIKLWVRDHKAINSRNKTY
eukprot:scaffold54355_cov18-Tisochrysis_lutea.AAC.1